jgi:hypothetical protein
VSVRRRFESQRHFNGVGSVGQVGDDGVVNGGGRDPAARTASAVATIRIDT